MRGKIDDELLNRVVEIPTYLFLNRMRGEKGLKVAKIADALRVMEVGQAIVYTTQEFHNNFGRSKNAIQMLRINLKDQGIIKPAIIQHEDKVYICQRSKV